MLLLDEDPDAKREVERFRNIDDGVEDDDGCNVDDVGRRA